MAVMGRCLEVALVVDCTKPYDRRIVRGVAACVQSKDLEWSLYVEEDLDSRLPDLKNWAGDGVIANLDSRHVASAVSKLRLPLVGIGGGYGYYKPQSLVPYVRTDNREIAHLASEHLLNLGLRNFAYCGAPPDRFNGWVNERERAFREFVEAAGFQCKTFKGRYRPANHWKKSQAELGKWLKSLPRPVGLFACNDSRARNVLQACHSVGLNVPEDIAVIGVDNDDIMCELSRPPLTSIEQGAIRIGFEAAMILNSLMSGKQPPVSTAIAPEGVVVRRSTELLATDDEDVAKALRFIRDHACRPIRVRDVLEVVAVSRSTLESRFREMIGRSIHCEIRRVQIERAIHLLRSTHLSMKRVSHEVGASSVQYFTSMVREHTGKTPGQIRKEAQR